MDNYLEYITTLIQELADIGRTIQNVEVAELILSGLPQEFDVLVSSLEAVTCSGAISSERARD